MSKKDEGDGFQSGAEVPKRPPAPQMMEDREKVFFGVRADSRIFDLYRTLLMEPEGPAARGQPARPAPIPATTR